MSQKEYAAIRKMMAEILEVLTTRVIACRDLEIMKFDGVRMSAACRGAEPIIGCVLAAQAMLMLVREDHPFENTHELFLALEHSATSVLNLIMILRAYDPDA